MKKSVYIFVAFILGAASCSKENNIIETVEPAAEKITFSASINLSSDTKASLADMVGGKAIHWSASDKIAVANDQNDEIEACSVTVDGEDASKCTFTVTAVDGATIYYAICVGDNITGITFDHTTGTFSGLNSARYEADKNNLSGSTLAMAGKSTDKTTFSMKPCLSLFHCKIHPESVESELAGGYTGVRGIYVDMKHSGSTVYPTGDYTVNLSGEMSVQMLDNSNKKSDKKVVADETVLMDSSADYYFTTLPVGAVEYIRFRFAGFKQSGENIVPDWDNKFYGMSTRQSLSIGSGDYFDFGTLNPVGAKKADDAFVPAINIDGSFTDWEASGVVSGVNTSSKITAWKYTSDAKNIYFYAVVPKSALTYDVGRDGYRKENYFYVGFDFDNDDKTGSGSASGGLGNGYDARAVVYPYTGMTEGTIEYIIGKDSRSSAAYCPTATSSAEWESASSWESIYTAAAASGDNTIVEFMVPRAKIGYPSKGTITVNLSFNYSAVGREAITIN